MLQKTPGQDVLVAVLRGFVYASLPEYPRRLRTGIWLPILWLWNADGGRGKCEVNHLMRQCQLSPYCRFQKLVAKSHQSVRQAVCGRFLGKAVWALCFSLSNDLDLFFLLFGLVVAISGHFQ